MHKIFSVTLILGLTAFCAATTVHADPYCKPCPYSCSDIGLGHKDCSNVSSTGGVCCVDLTEKGLELAKAQDSARNQVARVNPSQDRCPSGFQPSEQKCTQHERQNGCKDIRLPSGLGCVHR